MLVVVTSLSTREWYLRLLIHFPTVTTGAIDRHTARERNRESQSEKERERERERAMEQMVSVPVTGLLLLPSTSAGV